MTSVELHARALRTAPGGVHSPVRAFKSVGGTPVFIRSAAGARMTDVEGRIYIDFCQSFGPLILGHRDETVRTAVLAAIDDGWSYGTADPYSLALAEWIISRLPWVERVRFVSSRGVRSSHARSNCGSRLPVLVCSSNCPVRVRLRLDSSTLAVGSLPKFE